MGKKLWYKLEKNQVARFILSAGIGFLVDISAFYILYHNLLTQKSYFLFDFTLRNSTVSLMISYFLGVVANFTISKYIVFSESRSSSYKQFFRFTSVAIIGFFANLGMIDVFIHYLDMYPPLARPLAMLSLFFASFFVHKFFSFSLSMRHQHTRSHKNTTDFAN
jgi:putative flippase GtrA